MGTQRKSVREFAQGEPWSITRLINHKVNLNSGFKDTKKITAHVGHKLAALWLVLEEISHQENSHVITPSRRQLCELMGIKTQGTVSRLLTLLHNAGWVTCTLSRFTKDGQHLSFLRIVMRRNSKQLPRTKLKKKEHTAVKLDSGVEAISISRPTGPHDVLVEAINILYETYREVPWRQLFTDCSHEYVKGERLAVFFKYETQLKTALEHRANHRLFKYFESLGEFNIDVKFCLTKPATASVATLTT